VTLQKDTGVILQEGHLLRRRHGGRTFLGHGSLSQKMYLYIKLSDHFRRFSRNPAVDLIRNFKQGQGWQVGKLRKRCAYQLH
jgi:hypothetical protein